MRMASGHYELIDLDASMPISAVLGAKSSSAFAPPEMVTQIEGRSVVRSYQYEGDEPVPDGTFTLLSAAPAYDIFASGCIIVHALAKRPLINVRSVLASVGDVHLAYRLTSSETPTLFPGGCTG